MNTLPDIHLSDHLILLGGRCQLSFKDILFIEAQRSYTVFWRVNGEYVMTSRPLGWYESSLPDYLVRVHKSYIVNLNYVVSFKDTTIRLIDGRQVMVSRRRKSFINKFLRAHLNI
ncbi:LytR/AlgR family response regulator transcription factor [Runella sp.]|uniref:LytR/AlgR family response regulator transcription factor n=1 Tax=Runella sp. TaxID=1960881 RepID=UPI003D10BC88